MKDEPALTPEVEALIARRILENEPHLLVIQDRIKSLSTGYGSLDIKVEVRGGRVEKVTFYEGYSWVREKSDQRLDPTSRK